LSADLPTGAAVSVGDRMLLVATRNAGKARELSAVLSPLGYRAIDLDAAGVPREPAEDAVEVHDSFAANALAKARFYAAASGGLPTLADDSGLEVAALGGAPGVRSRRWSGVEGSDAVVSTANNTRLLELLRGVEDRSARFVCALALVRGGEHVVVLGETAGRIASEPRGAHGFGYDPLFESAELGWRTFAEATVLEKTAVSHRGRALAELQRRVGAVDGSTAFERR
jgi:XTP/dITP diphosphohydrolase